jgi:hypothetical protein
MPLRPRRAHQFKEKNGPATRRGHVELVQLAILAALAVLIALLAGLMPALLLLTRLLLAATLLATTLLATLLLLAGLLVRVLLVRVIHNSSLLEDCMWKHPTPSASTPCVEEGCL